MTVHFVQRVRERGPAGIDAEKLRDDVRQAILAQCEDYIERVKVINITEAIYRLRLAEGIFYAICNPLNGTPITFYTQAQYRGKRFGLKCRRRNLPLPGDRKVHRK